MIKFYNRKTKEYEIEKVAGEKYLNWIYSSPSGMRLLELIAKKKFFSWIYGKFCDSRLSSKKIKKFIDDFDIDMSISEKPCETFCSFNDFFTRKLKPSARPFTKDNNILISPGDGRLSAYQNIDVSNILQIKGITYKFSELLNSENLCKKYDSGTCIVLRLCPTDYHRFHFIDDGICESTRKIKGFYYSVNPAALKKIPQLFCKNKREWSTFHSENFGDIIYVEVGATCVGSIFETYEPYSHIKKGQEKGYFKFGGSTVILFFEKGKIIIDDDILKQSDLGCEVKVNMGETIGKSSSCELLNQVKLN